MKIALGLAVILIVIVALCLWVKFHHDRMATQTEQAVELAAQERYKRECEEFVGKIKSVHLETCGPIPDGGSCLFDFSSEGGARFKIRAAHVQLPSNDIQRGIFLELAKSGGEEVSVEAGSNLEIGLVTVLVAAIDHENTRGGSGNSNASACLNWLLSRIRDRRKPWEVCPSLGKP